MHACRDGPQGQPARAPPTPAAAKPAGTAQASMPDVPDAPTISELGFPGFEAVAWIGLTSPSGMPRSDRERIQSVVTQALNFPEFAEKLRSIGAIPRPMPIDEFAAFMRSEQVRWKALVEQSGVKL